jgi:hypothetical protein
MCRCGCGLYQFHPGFLDQLEKLRVAFNEPMNVNSACRCAKHNRAVGGTEKSLHIGDAFQHPDQKGAMAVDIRSLNGAYRGRLFSLAWDFGWAVGWGKGFLHLDRRADIGLPQTTFDY